MKPRRVCTQRALVTGGKHPSLQGAPKPGCDSAEELEPFPDPPPVPPPWKPVSPREWGAGRASLTPIAAGPPGGAGQRPEPLGRRGEEATLGFQSGRRRGAAAAGGGGPAPEREQPAARTPACPLPPSFPPPYSHRPFLRAVWRGEGRRAERRGWLAARRAPPGGEGGNGSGKGHPPRPGCGPAPRITNKEAADWLAGGACAFL